MKKVLFGVGIAALAATGASAQTAAPAAPIGDITRAQAIAAADAQFAKIDLDKNGQITREEMMQARPQTGARRGGAELTPEQREARRAEWAKRRAERGEGAAPRGEGRGRMFGEQGFITQAQYRDRLLQGFDRMDANRDGVATVAEREQAQAQLRQQRAERRERAPDLPEADEPQD